MATSITLPSITLVTRPCSTSAAVGTQAAAPLSFCCGVEVGVSVGVCVAVGAGVFGGALVEVAAAAMVRTKASTLSPVGVNVGAGPLQAKEARIKKQAMGMKRLIMRSEIKMHSGLSIAHLHIQHPTTATPVLYPSLRKFVRKTHAEILLHSI